MRRLFSLYGVPMLTFLVMFGLIVALAAVFVFVGTLLFLCAEFILETFRSL